MNVTNSLDNCTICLEPMRAGQQKQSLTCGHLFHDACITPWLNLNANNTCPTCRVGRRIVQQHPAPNPAEPSRTGGSNHSHHTHSHHSDYSNNPAPVANYPYQPYNPAPVANYSYQPYNQTPVANYPYQPYYQTPTTYYSQQPYNQAPVSYQVSNGTFEITVMVPNATYYYQVPTAHPHRCHRHHH